MATDIKLPNLGDGVDDGDILEVLVKPGDVISKDQGILEIETGKATMQVPSSAAGKVLKVHVASGQKVSVGTLLLTLEAAAASGAPPVPPKPAAPAAKPAAVAPPKPAPAAVAPAAPKPAPPKPAPPAPAPPAPRSSPSPQPLAPSPAPVALVEPASDGGVAAGPAVRRFAREVGVDLARVAGTGPSGRITREDVLAVVRQTSQQAAASPAGKKGGTATAHDQWGPIRVEKMPKIRKVIAAKMHESWMTCPRVTNFDDADVTELEKIRVSSKDDYAKKGIKLTSLPFVIKAVASALRNHPTINAAVDPEQDQIIYKEYVNIGIAVDTDRGLVVPSLRRADELSIADIARSLAALADNVRDGSFSLADLQGSTFTISNLGAVGGTYSTPIINTPEVAILLVGRSRKMPVVVDDEIAVRLMMPLSLAYDHRLVDGATAARFLNDVIDYLEAPSRLLLAP
ncbi:MAG: 2-oxo acid dehydrogenase subunit E2 [Pirellulaceae bacterium]|nr:2-oxo acid dehydrogenase subunit E2 [Pirellulaceae bacterium]